MQAPDPFFVSGAMMSVADLIREFDVRTSVPVDVNDVVDALARRGIKDSIYFFGVDIDAEKLRGQIVHWDPDTDWEWPTDATQTEMVSVAEVYYAKSLSDDWQRLVSCKEVVHILDPAGARASTKEEVHRLTQNIVLAPEYQNGLEAGWPTVNDRAAILQAAGLLFPWRAREIFISSGKLTNAEIARLVDLPIRYVTLVMSDVWPNIHDLLLRS